MFARPISDQIARAQRAPAPAASSVQEEWQNNAFPFRPDPTKARQPSEQRNERRERSEQVDRAPHKRCYSGRRARVRVVW
ncbi:MAG: hypothetical protein K0R13_1995 [Propionibacteriaceae bacterium]|jgi:hypothetical protein|nr:hypothetical protein [Propionibacteriaceae bacterium]